MRQTNRVARQMMEARLRAGLFQRQLAELMGTSQSTISRLESGQDLPTVATLEKLAEVTGHRLEMRFVPIATRRA
jgi:transcriptional regulator with XRE-family HTH domain